MLHKVLFSYIIGDFWQFSNVHEEEKKTSTNDFFFKHLHGY